MCSPHRIVIIGGGFGGLNVAVGLRKANAQVTVIDRRNFHLFQPLLYQVASGALSPANIASPLRGILRGQQNARVLLGEVMDVDVTRRQLVLAGDNLQTNRIPYDTLVVAAGASHSYFGNDHWQPMAPGLKTIEEATEIRQRLLSAFEAAEHASWRGAPASEIRRLLTFVVIGAGPTGVEMAGALGEITRETLRGNFRHIDPAAAQIYLVEHADRVLPPFSAGLSAKARQALIELGVQVRLGTLVTEIKPDHIVVSKGGELETIATQTVVWAAGVKASPLGLALCRATGASSDRSGRVMVTPTLNVPGYDNIFVLGDLAHCTVEGRPQPLPGVAPVAMQQGDYVGKLLCRRMQDRAAKTPPFRYTDMGSMATIGRGRAVVEMRGLRFSGTLAWLAWLFVHLLKLVGFHNKLLVLMEWGWLYATHGRPARLITSAPKLPSFAAPPPEAPGQETQVTSAPA